MEIAMGADHAGFRYKEMIKKYLKERGNAVKDFGTFSEDPVDYPVFVRPVAEGVSKGEFDRGVVLGGSGNGEAIAANRIKGVRCALCWNRESAVIARKHNDANMLSLGERLISEEDAMEVVKAWLDTPYEWGRHVERNRQIDEDELNDNKRAKSTGDTDPDKSEKKTVKKTVEREREGYSVLISFRYIMYSEGRNSLELKVDPSLKGPSVIHVPGPEKWKDEVVWAGDRREEITARIESKCQHMFYKLEVY